MDPVRELEDVRHVMADQDHRQSAVAYAPDQVEHLAGLRLPGDVLAHFDCGFVLPFRDELEVVGEDGSLFVDDPWHVHAPGIELRRDGETEAIRIAPTDSYALELENVSDAILGHGELLLGRADAVGQAAAIEALYRAAETRQPVEVPS